MMEQKKLNNHEVVRIALAKGGPMTPTQISEWVLDNELRREWNLNRTWGALNGLKNKGEVEKEEGLYRIVARRKLGATSSSESGHEPLEGAAKASSVAGAGATKLIPCYGMNWLRDQVEWDHNHNLIGKGSDDGMHVNFAYQNGVYVLYDWPNVTYVGRVTRGRMYERLQEHATNQSGRWHWDRFSWFGMLSVGSDGKLASHRETLDARRVIMAMETLMIAVLSPPLNDKSGDHLGDRYYQVPDEAIQERERKELADQFSKLMAKYAATSSRS